MTRAAAGERGLAAFAVHYLTSKTRTAVSCAMIGKQRVASVYNLA